MPQLLLDPWFLIFLCSWMIFICLSPKKILSYSFLNEPNLKTFKIFKSPWSWQW
uniref:ATP synthase F0 subunit 8 n=1 Tax=Limnonectes blythii TaxID=109962 RepID=UPI00226CB3CA|nr:ATP synthase F0 subunit 8 [Limnonectes blythii]UZC57494.1 ATP synthase F0 subunit 8 [Limnonectes blythii]